jgi:crotonobetainyl-CoA:carnitine CoA-transferase CaiB-like acyl-CoA transferase
MAFGNEHNTPIAPVNTPKTIADDPQFQHRLPWIPAAQLEADMLPYPAMVTDAEIPVPTRAPNAGEHTDDVLRGAGYDDARIKALREAGVVS